MIPEEIKERIDINNKAIETHLLLSKFVLNKEVKELMDENDALQRLCEHEFENGFCKYCYLPEQEEA